MNWVDTLVLLIVATSAVIAFADGFISEGMRIVPWIGAYFAARQFAEPLRPLVRGWIGSTEIADPVAFAGVFLAVLILLAFLASLVLHLSRNFTRGWLDRTLGVVFGLARGAVVVGVLYLFAGLIPLNRWPPTVWEALSIPYLHDVAEQLAVLLPPDFHLTPVPVIPPEHTLNAADLLQTTPQGRATAPR